MATYRGIIRGNTVELLDPIGLEDGAIVEVEVRGVLPPPATEEERQREDEFTKHLIEIGLMTAAPTHAPDPPGLDRTPITVTGKPVSETIIEERR